MSDVGCIKGMVEGNTEWSGAICDTSSSYLKGIADDSRERPARYADMAEWQTHQI